MVRRGEPGEHAVKGAVAAAVPGVWAASHGTVRLPALPQRASQSVYRCPCDGPGAAAIPYGGRCGHWIPSKCRIGRRHLALGGNARDDIRTCPDTAPRDVSDSKKKAFTFGVDDWISGTMSFSGPRENRNLEISSRLSGLNLETLFSGTLGGDIRISGSVHGNLALRARGNNPWVTEYDMSLEKLRVHHPSTGMFAQSPITGTLQGSAMISPRQLSFRDTALRAEMFHADIRGVIYPGNPLSSSRLRLTADFRRTSETTVTQKRRPPPTGRKPSHLPKGLVSFKISGTLKQPLIQMTRPVD